MAQIFGEPSRNAAEQSFKHTKRLLGFGMGIMAVAAAIGGYGVSAVLPIPRFSWPAAVLIIALFWLFAWFVARWGTNKIDAIDRERMSWRKGAAGEALVAGVLETLPDDFVVVHDITKRFGNIDHVVIGPTGVYVIDTKNWKGRVSANGSGELLRNAKPCDKPTIKTTLRAVMDFQNKLKALVEKEHFVRGLLVFPMAYVEANFGSTKQIHCLRDDQLVDYIQNQTFSARLQPDDIKRIKRATLQLANMDEGFAG
jgi:hypothetical protein